ncbi:MAG TPA: ribose 5-phosphate isomerase A [Oligoflexia bacterium]|nr:ribose 5-phosphate isomerase A [Oligoflexia bacterium]HMP49582.1 ribose 5-phosphate isomerase A [Oligoflexia bacterium]
MSKEILAERVAARVVSGQTIGLGTASTAEAILNAIGKRIKEEGLIVSGVSTSLVTTRIASRLGIVVHDIASGVPLDWAFDGADEVDPYLRLIKGRGGALLKEKIVARRSPHLVIALTSEKKVSRLGEKYPVPVEVLPQSVSYVESELIKLGAEQVLPRTGSNFYGPLFTESGNLLLDASFSEIKSNLGSQIKSITGVVEHGIFENFSSLEVLCADSSGNVEVLKK